MKVLESLSPEQSNIFSNLFIQYLHADPLLHPLYAYEMSAKGIQTFIKEHTYAHLDRLSLSNVLLSQGLNSPHFSPEQKKSINLLSQKNSYTITTGHQLCLFSGPLYFIYKIITVINEAEKMNALDTAHNYIPVFWMASEDHDFAEINHLHIHQKTIKWNRDSNSAVGKLSLENIDQVIQDLSKALGPSDRAKSWIEIVKSCYQTNKTLAEATRAFVNQLFGQYGLIVIDADASYFKKQFVSVFEADLLEQKTWKAYQKTEQYFHDNGLNAQVLVRQCNLFYMNENIRTRIEQDENGFHAVDSTEKWNKTEMKALLESHPETLSPNVILRPLFQQCILPNAVYVGGPSENDYWLQLKAIFEAYQVPYPVLIPRQFAVLQNIKNHQLLQKLNLSLKDLLLPENQLISTYLEQNHKSVYLTAEKSKIEHTVEQVIQSIAQIDQTLERTGIGELKRIQKSLEKLEKKANKAVKIKEEVQVNRLRKLKNEIMPLGHLQERYDNIMMFDLELPLETIRQLKGLLNANPGHLTFVQY
jgi:bacillithiol synthase